MAYESSTQIPLPSNVRVIVSDLDGTLLRDDKTLSPRTRRALAAAREAGIRTGVATARPSRLARAVVGDVRDVLDFVVTSNGASVLDAGFWTKIHESIVPAGQAAALLTALRGAFPTAGFGWELGDYFEGDAEFDRISADPRVLRDAIEGRVAEFPSAAVHQLVLAVANSDPLDLVGPVQRFLGEDYAVTESGGGVVEISPVSATKASAVAWYAGTLGASLDDVVAFGDGLNDVPMLRAAGTGVAMAHASDAVRNAADGVAPSNMDDGVARVIEEILAAR